MCKLLVIFILVLFPITVLGKKEKSTPLPAATYALWNVETGQLVKGTDDNIVRPIASMTKLMSTLVVMRENLDLEETLTVTGKETSSRIRVGMKIARGKLIELALISSDNLATRTLAENFPGGYTRFISEMNRVASELGMTDTKYEDSTGLLSGNISSPKDIRELVMAVSPLYIINQAANTAKIAFNTTIFSKNKAKQVTVQGINTNSFVGKLDIIAAKTGYTSKAGRCLTMLFNYNGTKYLLVIMGAHSNEQRRKLVEYLIDSIK